MCVSWVGGEEVASMEYGHSRLENVVKGQNTYTHLHVLFILNIRKQLNKVATNNTYNLLQMYENSLFFYFKQQKKKKQDFKIWK